MRRFVVCMFGALSLLASATAQAQPAPGTISQPMSYAPAPYNAPNSGPEYGAPAYNYPQPTQRLTADQLYGPGPDGLITERVQAEGGLGYADTPMDRYLTSVGKSTWLRLEYMDWVFDRPGNTLLGSQVAGQTDPSKSTGFQATIAGQPATVRVPTTENLKFQNQQGIRGTFGLDTTMGTFETSFFAFQHDTSSDFQLVPPALVLNPAAQIQIATSTLTNGQPGTNLFLYDQSFKVVQTNSFFGAEANWIGKSPYEDGFVTRPSFGFRYLDFAEKNYQTGVFDQQGLLDPPVVSHIDSDANNRVYAPQIGMRFEFVQPWFTVGFEPKVAFGVNTFDNSVSTVELRSTGDPRVTTTDSGVKFAPIGDFSVYSRIRLRDNFSLNVGYQVMVASGISRPANNILYNDNGSGQPAAVVVKSDFQNMVWQGLNVGCELRFR